METCDWCGLGADDVLGPLTADEDGDSFHDQCEIRWREAARSPGMGWTETVTVTGAPGAEPPL